jgi:MYXO-CTERM domain-containing protein
MRHRRAIPLILASALVTVLGCADTEGRDTERTTQPIIGGEPAGAWEYPATGGLVLDGQIFCTGTLVTPSAVLTAAHCIDPEELEGRVPGFTLLRDEAQLTEGDIHRDVYDGLNVQMNPGYIRDAVDTSPGLVSDIGILLLRQAVEEVEPEQLITRGEAGVVLVLGEELTIVGYGFTDVDLTRSGIKFKATTPLVYIGPFEIQMSEPGDPQPCYGDSGGPVFVTLASGERRIAGVVSRGPGEEGGCDSGAIATRVDPYKEWVDSASETVSCSAAGHRAPPWSVVGALLLALLLIRRRRLGLTS